MGRVAQLVELFRNLVAHDDAWEGKWKGNWQMECVASTHTPPPNVVYPALLKLMRTPRLPAVDWTEAPTDLNGLVRFGERRNLVSALVVSRSARAIQCLDLWLYIRGIGARFPLVAIDLSLLQSVQAVFLFHPPPIQYIQGAFPRDKVGRSEQLAGGFHQVLNGAVRLFPATNSWLAYG